MTEDSPAFTSEERDALAAVRQAVADGAEPLEVLNAVLDSIPCGSLEGELSVNVIDLRIRLEQLR